jgi:hypothetical protein
MCCPFSPSGKDLSGNRLYSQVNYLMVKTDLRDKAFGRLCCSCDMQMKLGSIDWLPVRV